MMRCPLPSNAWSYIATCAGVTADTWAAHLKDCMLKLHKMSQNPSEASPYLQEPYPHATAKQNSTVYKMMNVPIFTTINYS